MQHSPWVLWLQRQQKTEQRDDSSQRRLEAHCSGIYSRGGGGRGFGGISLLSTANRCLAHGTSSGMDAPRMEEFKSKWVYKLPLNALDFIYYADVVIPTDTTCFAAVASAPSPFLLSLLRSAPEFIRVNAQESRV